jgi:hypothetical protein
MNATKAWKNELTLVKFCTHNAAGVAAAREHAEGKHARDRPAEQREQPDRLVPEGFGIEARDPHRHAGGQHAAHECHDTAERGPFAFRPLRAEHADKITGEDRRDGVERTAERAHGRGKDARDDQADHPVGQFMRNEVAHDGIVGQARRQPGGIGPIEGE